MEKIKSIHKLSFGEVLEQIELTSKQGRKYPLGRLNSKLLNLFPSKKLSYNRKEQLSSISIQKLQKVLIKNFVNFFKKDATKTIKLITSFLSIELQDEIIIKRFEKIFQVNSEKTIELVTSILSIELQEEIVMKNFEKIFKINSEKTIELLTFVFSKELQDEIIIKNFKKIFQIDFEKSVELLISISSKELQEEAIIENFKMIFLHDNYQNEKHIENLFKLISILEEKKELLLTTKEQLVYNLFFIQNTLDSNLKRKAILKSYKKIYLQNNSIIFDIDFIFNLLPEVSNSKNSKNLLKKIEKEFIHANLNNDYNQFIQLIISNSKNINTYKIKSFLENKLRPYVEEKESKKVISEIIDNILDNPNKEELFIEEFTKQYNLNTLFRFIPEVAKRDSDLAISLLDRLEHLHYLSIEEIFLEIYKDNLSHALLYYNKLNNFYTKEKLSKQAIAHHLPTFTNSFFYKSLSALDSRNIMNTLDELATIAPKEVLKYYGEIEDEVEKAFDEVLEQIKVLQGRAIKAEELNDEQGFKEILEEEKKLKISIRADEKLFELFLEKYNLNNLKFMRLNLLDFEV